MRWLNNMIVKIAGKKIGKEIDKMSEDNKKWYASKTIWAGVVAIIIAGYNTGAAQFGWPAVPEWVYTLLGAVGIYGRVNANKTIG